MATERESALPRAFSDVLSDVADLFQKELRLARAELSSKLSIKLRAGIWLATAAGLALVVVILLAQALVLWIAATFAITVHSSCLIVAVSLAAVAALAYYRGRRDAQETISPSRTLHQIERDIIATKEQLR
jgi:putative superfamily III holin-X